MRRCTGKVPGYCKIQNDRQREKWAKDIHSLFNKTGFENMYQIMYQIKKHQEVLPPKCFIFSVPARARTVDPLIKSQLLYQLSYRDIGIEWEREIREK